MTDHDSLDLIRIRLPLKLDIAAALTKAIGTMWPEAVMLTDGYGGDLVAGIPKGAKARTAKRPLQAAAREVSDTDPQVTLTKLTPNGGTILLEPQDAMRHLAEWAYTVLTATDGAINYVEQQVHLPDDLAAEHGHHRLTITAAWSEHQTPHELREKAEQKAQDLEARLTEAHNKIRQLGGTP